VRFLRVHPKLDKSADTVILGLGMGHITQMDEFLVKPAQTNLSPSRRRDRRWKSKPGERQRYLRIRTNSGFPSSPTHHSKNKDATMMLRDHADEAALEPG
jgi:hypothetical protein